MDPTANALTATDNAVLASVKNALVIPALADQKNVAALLGPVLVLPKVPVGHAPVDLRASVASLVDAKELTAHVERAANALLALVPVEYLALAVNQGGAKEQTVAVDPTANAKLVLVLAVHLVHVSKVADVREVTASVALTASVLLKPAHAPSDH